MVHDAGAAPAAYAVSMRRSTGDLIALEFTPLQRRVDSGLQARSTMLVLHRGIEPRLAGV